MKSHVIRQCGKSSLTDETYSDNTSLGGKTVISDYRPEQKNMRKIMFFLHERVQH